VPLEGNVRYRWKTYPSGKKVRLAFRGNQVVETKSAQTGEIRHPKRKSRKIAKKIYGH